MNRAAAFLLDFTFPCYCVSCGVPVSSRYNHLCRRCFNTLKLAERGCPVCSSVPDKSACAFCSGRIFYPSRHISVFEYEGAVKSIIHALKFDGLKHVYRIIVPFLADCLADFGDDIDLITSVPMNRKKYAARGYNQSELLAQSLSKSSGIPFLKLLREKGDSMHQREFSYSARYINVIDRYETIHNNKINDKSILIIDDVFTTGATINECSRQLLSSGARSVFSLTVARSDLKKLENI